MVMRNDVYEKSRNSEVGLLRIKEGSRICWLFSRAQDSSSIIERTISEVAEIGNINGVY